MDKNHKPLQNQLQIQESFARTLLSIFPPGVGTFLTELIFDFHTRIKQDRLNKFVELFSEYFLEESNINLENLNNEDFCDLFESVLKRVVLTKSESKLKRYKNILVQKINDPSLVTNYSEIYLDLVNSLSENDIMILSHYSAFTEDYHTMNSLLNKLQDDLLKNKDALKKEKKFINNYSILVNDSVRLKEEIKLLNKKIEDYSKCKNADFYGISEQQFLYSKQILYSKGLLIDSGIGSIGGKPFESMTITKFGIEFLNFIMKK